MNHECPYHWQYLDAIDPRHQDKVGWCGPASLEIALRALGKPITQQEIVDSVDNIDDGMSWEEMIEVAENYGCSVVMYKNAEYNALVNVYDRTGCPIIVGWNSDRDGEPGAHFSVVKYANREMITLADPEYKDLFSLSRQAFEAVWKDDESERTFMVVMPKP